MGHGGFVMENSIHKMGETDAQDQGVSFLHQEGLGLS